MTFYLKYRPQTIEELDKENVRNSLNKIVAGDIPHAFLFSGPKGTGKTSAARILAKVINCKDRKGSVEPCNKCESCVSITNGTNIDVLEIDAASHRGIDDIRSLREAVKLAPAYSQKKIYIIDEVHMLTTEAANALLKTLEEPPGHVVFILATTNPEKLLPTILSRVTHIKFTKATREEFMRSLSRIAKKEKLDISKEIVEIICNHADGSFRDAVKILEQLSLEAIKLEAEDVNKYLNEVSNFEEEKFLELLINKDAAELLKMVNVVVERGASAKNITQNLIQTIRKRVVEDIVKETQIMQISEMVDLIQLLTNSLHDIGVSTMEQIPLELAIVRWCLGGDNFSKESKKQTGTMKVQTSAPAKAGNKKSKKVEINQDKSPSSEEIESRVPQEDFGSEVSGTLDGDLWSKALVLVRQKNASTEALLRAAKPISFDGKIVTVGVYYSFHKERLESSPHRMLLEDTLSILLGGNVRILCKLTTPNVAISSNDVQESLQSEQDVKTDVVLTEEKDDDIVSIAEKIFS